MGAYRTQVDTKMFDRCGVYEDYTMNDEEKNHTKAKTDKETCGVFVESNQNILERLLLFSMLNGTTGIFIFTGMRNLKIYTIN